VLHSEHDEAALVVNGDIAGGPPQDGRQAFVVPEGDGADF
jgi:hypothetical protein